MYRRYTTTSVSFEYIMARWIPVKAAFSTCGIMRQSACSNDESRSGRKVVMSLSPLDLLECKVSCHLHQ